jgi:hypothetical protein
MFKKVLIFLLLSTLLLAGCQPSGQGEIITGEVIEILPNNLTDGGLINNEDQVIDIVGNPEIEIGDQTLEPEDPYSDILVRLQKEEGDLISLKPNAYDPDGDKIIYTFSKPFNKSGLWQTVEGDAGTYVVTITASDGFLSTSEDILIIVNPTNKAPIIECPETLKFQETELVNLDCDVTDLEGDKITVVYSGWMNSSSYVANYDDSGVHEVTITVSDGMKSSTKKLSIEVINKNRLPQIVPIASITVEETDKITLEVDASDADSDDLTFEFSDEFSQNGVWRTELGDAGTYESYVIVSDGEAEVMEEFTVTITLKNTAPVLEFIDPISVDEGSMITLPIDAYDREGDELEILIEGWFETETYTTTYDDAGVHNVTVTVSDGELEVSQLVEITVNNVNRPPVFKIPV